MTARTRFKPLYTLFVNKWYFDELIDALVVKPAAAAGRFAGTTFERVFVDGAIVGGATGLVKAGSASVRAVQTGLLRYYAALSCSASRPRPLLPAAGMSIPSTPRSHFDPTSFFLRPIHD